MDNKLLMSSNAFEFPNKKKPDYKMLVLVTIIFIILTIILEKLFL